MDTAWMWLIAGVALAIAEIVTPGVFLIWLGAAAILTGALGLGLHLSLPAEFGLFAVSACALVILGRALIVRSPIISDDPLLNERIARLIGRKVVVVEALIGGEGRVRVADGVWPAIGPDAAEGALVEVVGCDGSRLRVEPTPP
jgi:membrane protein implicated in regulation of membrane protease activity